MGTDNNVFNENVDFIIQARDEVAELDKLKAKSEDIKNGNKRLKKQILAEEKSITDEIANTLKKRKAEIENSYDKEIDSNRDKIKSIKNKRSKVKGKQVNKRVEEETAELNEELRRLKVEIKTLFKKEHVPGFCNSTFYYSLFMPKGFTEFLTLIITALVGLIGLPAIAYILVDTLAYSDPKKTMSNILGIVIVAGIITVLFAIYFIIFNMTKLKYRDILAEGRQIRTKMKTKTKNIKAVKNAINKDQDESIYDLDKYDEKIEKIESETEKVAKKKQEALTVFENETTTIITDEINNRRIPKLKKMREDYKKRETATVKLDEGISEKSIAITNSYETYIGKEFCTVTKLNDLIALMKDGTADTVSEAIATYKCK